VLRNSSHEGKNAEMNSFGPLAAEAELPGPVPHFFIGGDFAFIGMFIRGALTFTGTVNQSNRSKGAMRGQSKGVYRKKLYPYKIPPPA
jgi:hypothetical protein